MKCLRCGKTTNKFRDGYKTCEACRYYKHIWYEKNRNKLLPKLRQWHKDNREKHREANKRFTSGKPLYKLSKNYDV